MTEQSRINEDSEQNASDSLINRRDYLKGTAAAVAAAGGLSGSASANYDTVVANGQTVWVGAGETYENKLIDLSTGNDFIIIVSGENSVVRNIGFEGIYRGGDFMISITAPSGHVLVENVYLGDGATKEGSSHPHGPGGIFYHKDADCDVTFRYCNVMGYPNNAFYCSNSATGGDITWENCHAKNNGVSCYRGASANDEIINCVAYNDDTAPYFPGRLEDAGRAVWAWNPGPVTIKDSHFHSGLGNNQYPYALVAGANGNPSQIDYESGAFVGDVQEADGSTINISSQVGNNPDLSPPAGCPTSPEEAASGGGGESGDPPEPPVIDDFERENALADYGGRTDLFSVTSSTVYEGSSALINDGGDFGSAVSTSGLNEYPSRGQEFHVHFNNASDDNFVATHFFAQSETDNPDGYTAGISGFSAWKLWRNDGGSATEIASEGLPASEQLSGWYRAEIWTDDTTVYADLYDDNTDQLLASIQADDTDYSAGGIGFRSAGNGEVWDYAVDADGGDPGPTVVDDFERSSPLADYGARDDLFSVTSSTVYEGSSALVNDGGDFGSTVSTSGLDTYPERGDEVHVHFNNASDDNFAAFHLFAQSETDNPDGYTIGISGFSAWKLWRNDGGSLTELGSEDLPASEQLSGWYRAEISTDSSTVYADLYDDSTDQLLASIQADDTDYSAGGIGFRSAGNGEVWDYVVLD